MRLHDFLSKELALTEYLTEQEQVQQLKDWIKQYGFTVLAGIVLALLISSGWRYWQNYRNKILTHASVIYDEMLTLRAQNNTAGAEIQAKKLVDQYAKTPYASMASLMLAREAILNKNNAEAITQLNWVLSHGKDQSLREITRIRLARVLIADNNIKGALDLLKKIDDKSFIGLVNEVRGDAYMKQNDINAARNAWQLALSETPDAEINRPILQMKYDSLAIKTS
jgi:predicted negative regulator of RcsB-dependent stress response